MPEPMDSPADFFISRAGADKGVAMRIAAIIKEAGLTVFYQDEDFGPSDFMRRMEQAYRSKRTIALLSPEYEASEYTRKEYNTVLKLDGDPANLKQRLIVFMVAPYTATGNLATLAYTDLVPVLNDEAALRRLVRAALGIDKADNAVAYWRSFHRAGQQILHPDIREVKGFTGREDLLESLKHKLAKKSTIANRNSNQTTLALRGMGGVGKTVLAQEYAWRNRKDYHGVWLLRAETRETLVDDLVALGRNFIPGLEGLEPEEAAKKTIDQVSQMHTGKPWLLVYDNVDDPNLIRKLTPADNAHVLITTRHTDWHDQTDEQLAVDVFEPETAISFLLQRARHPDRDQAEQLAKALGYLPLALSHARAYCWERNWQFDQYLQKLPELIAKAPKNASYPASVFATFNLAIEKAAADCPEAERLMGLLSFFAPEQIPLWLIPGEVMSETERADALAALDAVSLLAFEKANDGTPAISVHRLVQEVMRGRLREKGALEVAAAEAIRLVDKSYDHSEAFAASAHNSAWLPHASACTRHAPRTGEAALHSVWTLYEMGDFRVTRGDLPGASAAYNAGKEIAQGGARADPGHAGWQRDLSVSYNKVGEVLVAQGNLAQALKAYEDSLAIRERLAKADPGNAGWQRDLSVSYERVGDVLVAQGNLAQALKAYEDSLAIRERLAKADPGNAGWQRDLSVSYERVGDVLVAQGNLAQALKAYEDSLAIRERLAKADPGNAGWQRDLSVSYERVGDVLVAQGNLAQALKAYEDSLAIAERLAKADPGNAGWQRDLSVSYNKVGEVLVAQGNLAQALKAYEDSLAIRERLAKADPGNAGWQRDLSVSYNKVGEVLVAQGNLAQALKAYEDSLAIAERLAKADPGHAGWQRDLSVSYNKVGEVLVAQGNLAQALKAYEDSLAIRERLAKADPGNAGWQRDLSVSYAKLSQVYLRLGERAQAKAALLQGRAIMDRVIKISPDNAEWKRDLTWFDEQIAGLEEAQGETQSPLPKVKRSWLSGLFGS